MAFNLKKASRAMPQTDRRPQTRRQGIAAAPGCRPGSRKARISSQHSPLTGPSGRRSGALAAVLSACFIAAAPQTALSSATVDQPVAVLGGLDKITGRTQQIAVEVNDTAELGTLSVRVRACRVAPPEELPENAAFLEISDTPPGEESRSVYSGWMFSSSPAVAAMDHPVFDIWVVECVAEIPQPPEDMAFEGERLPLPRAGLIPPGLPEARR